MGSDKALLAFPDSIQGAINRPTTRLDAINRHITGRLTFVEHLTVLLAQSCDEVVIVARDEVQATTLSILPHIAPLASQQIQVIHDLIPDTGPLMGLYTGLSAIHYSHALVTAVDMPLVQAAMVTFLLSLPRDDALLIPRVQEAPQVLFALYPRAVLPQIQGRLQAERRDPRSLLDIVPVRYIEEEQLRRVDPELRSFVNVNTVEEYERL